MFVNVEKAKEMGILGVKVYVDGSLIDQCVAFDDGEGFADYHVIDSNGIPVVTGDEIMTKRMHGKVTLDLSECDNKQWLSQ